jgi:predicted dehydrogenase
MSKLKVGIIGCGSIAVKKHLPALQKLGDKVDITAFAGRNLDNLRHVASMFNSEAAIYNNYKELLEHADVDVVHICTPNALHAEMTVAALEAGKHVMCEKPMAVNSAEAQRMIDAERRSGKKLSISYQNRFRTDALLLKQACERGELGDIYNAKAHAIRRRGVPTWGAFMDKKLQGGGALIDIGTHALDLTLWCMNNYEVHSVTGVTHNRLKQHNQANLFGPWDPEAFEVEESAFAFITMKNGASIYLECAWAINRLDEREAMTTLSGTLGGAEMRRNAFTLEDELIFNTEMHGNLVETKLQNEANIAYVSPASETAADREIGDWIDAILEDHEPIVKSQEAFAVTRILEAVYKSAATKQPVFFGSD